jgi:hydrogenase maturation protease
MSAGGWEELRACAPRSVEVAGADVRRGSRVLLAPRAGGDIFDVALRGRTAIVDSIEEDVDGRLKVAVTVEDDPGRDLGEARQPGHRFFFALDEVEPLADSPPAPAARVLVAGIGNVFMGDDGFGVEVVRALADRRQPPGTDVADFGIRGMDLVYALGDGYDAAVFVDATPRGQAPGTLYVIEPELEDGEVTLDLHGMDPVKVLGLARELGSAPRRLLVVGCEPQTRRTGEEEDVLVELSEPVRAAVQRAVTLVEELVAELQSMDTHEEGTRR